MKSGKELQKILFAIDGKGYAAYRDIRGQYDFEKFILSIDYVQVDPFAPPSKIRVVMKRREMGLKEDWVDTRSKRIATADFLTRNFYENIGKYYDGTKGSGKSGLLTIDCCGQEILERTSVIIRKEEVEARFEVGLPAAGRKVMGKSAAYIFCEVIPQIVRQSLICKNIDTKALQEQVELICDQEVIREQLRDRGYVAFVGNGAILPRESGVSQQPLRKGSKAFMSPSSLEIELELPYKGKIRGMGIPQGITLIVGGGYHGKSTLLNALELGVYNHRAGDGREYVITLEDAFKIRAEDGRNVEKVNISPFINHLPNGKDTFAFSSENASGSTSQAANVMEALECGSKLLLIDEDTSATNFMIRDARMQRLVSADKEPITPFIDKVSQLSKEQGISTVLVVGGSGDYFDIADHVIMMDEYLPKDVTAKAKEIAREMGEQRHYAKEKGFGEITRRQLKQKSFRKLDRETRIKTRAIDCITYGKTTIDLAFVEQLIAFNQTNCIAVMLEYIATHLKGEEELISVVEKLYVQIEEQGLEMVSPYTNHPGNLALPRKYELCAAINRYRDLKL